MFVNNSKPLPNFPTTQPVTKTPSSNEGDSAISPVQNTNSIPVDSVKNDTPSLKQGNGIPAVDLLGDEESGARIPGCSFPIPVPGSGPCNPPNFPNQPSPQPPGVQPKPPVNSPKPPGNQPPPGGQPPPQPKPPIPHPQPAPPPVMPKPPQQPKPPLQPKPPVAGPKPPPKASS